MSIEIKIKSPTENSYTNIQNNVVENSLRIEEILGKTIDTCSFNVVDNERTFSFEPMSDIIIERNGKKLFAGLITLISQKTSGAGRVWTLKCQDYTTLLLTSFIFANFIADYIYDGLQGDKARIAYAFENCTWGTLQDNAEIDARTYIDSANESPFKAGGMTAENFDTVSLMDFMNTMCSYTNFSFYVDYDKNLHYYKRSTQTTAYELNDYAIPDSMPYGIAYRDIRVESDATSLSNQYLLFGTSIKSTTQTYNIQNDNPTQYAEMQGETEIKLGIEQIGVNVAMLAIAGRKHIAINLGGTDLTDDQIGIYGIDNFGLDIIVLHDVTGQKLYFKNAISGNIIIRYCYSYDYGQYYIDDSSVNKYGRKFCNVLSSPDGNTVASINHKLQTYQEQFAEPLITITLTVDSLDVGANDLDCGTWVKVVNHVLDIDRFFCIYRISTRIIGADTLEYELELRSWYTEN